MGKKAQSGRAKQKQKAQKKSPGGKVPFAKQFARGQLFDDDESSGPMFRGFAQRSGHNTPQTSNVKLRHQGIAFVSATTGPDTPVGQEKDTQMLDDEAIAAALAEQGDGQDDDFEDEDDVDGSALQTNSLEDTDADIAQGTEALHIHEPARADSSMKYSLDGAADVDMAPSPTPAPPQAANPPTPPQNDEPSFVIDIVGDPTIAAKFKSKSKSKAPVRAASPTPSDSSGDEIVFRGRKATVVEDPYSKPKSVPQQVQAKPHVSQSPPKPDVLPPPHKKREAHVTDDLLEALGVATESVPVRAPPATGWAGKAPALDKQIEDPSAGFTPAPEGSWWRKKGMPRPDLGLSPAEKKALDKEAAETSRKTKVGFAEPEEELGAEQTIASLQADWNNVRSEKKRAARMQKELGEDSGAADQPKSLNRAVVQQLGAKTSRRGKRGRKRQNQLLRDLDSDDSDEELAMARDYMENLKAQGEDIGASGLRSADGGPSLVVDGKVIGEDELLDDVQFETASSDSDSDLIGQDLDELEDDDEDDINASDYDSSDLEVDLEYDEREQWEDEEDIRRRRIEAMDDEMIARLFHKQAELGIDGDELVIDDGAFIGDEIEGFGDLDEARAGLEDLSNISFGRSAGKRPRRSGRKNDFSFPDASALADAVDQYGDNGFDIMDLDRPSLRPTKKGRKGRLPPELEALEDEELRDGLLGAWDNDRAKKSLKKQEREELRMQGLLGSAGKKGKADLNAKYLQGMTLAQVHDELRIFMEDEDQEVKSFPPMAKEDRAALHAIASRLNLTSKSQGQGKKRFPMLYKTNRTPDYNEASFRRILAASERGFLKNSSYKAKGGRGGASAGPGGRGGARGGRGGGGAGGHGLRDGEEVGANAKEIGKDNFGHRLMEKMGWTKGTALGKDGSGLLVPVAQVMKTGRGGLG